MPLGNGTGPRVQGMSTGRGRGFGGGRGIRGGNRAGVGGFCVCPSCKARVAHQQGKPCYLIKCPQCGAQMVRE